MGSLALCFLFKGAKYTLENDLCYLRVETEDCSVEHSWKASALGVGHPGLLL